MSKNDIIQLDLKNYTVLYTDIEAGFGKVKKYKTLKKVLKAVEKLQDLYNPEYGITIIQGVK